MTYRCPSFCVLSSYLRSSPPKQVKVVSSKSTLLAKSTRTAPLIGHSDANETEAYQHLLGSYKDRNKTTQTTQIYCSTPYYLQDLPILRHLFRFRARVQIVGYRAGARQQLRNLSDPAGKFVTMAACSAEQHREL